MRIVHTADLHLGYRQYGSAVRERDLYDVAMHIARRTVELKANMLLLAGDIFDSPKPSSVSVLALKALVEFVEQSGAVVAGIDGNHDLTGGNWLQICGVRSLHQQRYVHDCAAGRYTVAGLHATRTSEFMPALRQLVQQAVTEGVTLDVVVCHQMLGDMTAFADQLTALEMSLLLQQCGTRYVALGDVHDRKELSLGGCWFVYPGSPEMISASERQDKTFTVIDLEKVNGETVATPLAEPVPIRPFYTHDLTSDADLDKIIKMSEGETKPMFYLRYEPDQHALADRAAAALATRGALYRLIPRDAVVDTVSEQLERQGFERGGAMANLVVTVGEFFDKTSDEYQLVLQMLENPENVENIAKQYMETKGIKL